MSPRVYTDKLEVEEEKSSSKILGTGRERMGHTQT